MIQQLQIKCLSFCIMVAPITRDIFIFHHLKTLWINFCSVKKLVGIERNDSINVGNSVRTVNFRKLSRCDRPKLDEYQDGVLPIRCQLNISWVDKSEYSKIHYYTTLHRKLARLLLINATIGRSCAISSDNTQF